MSTPDDSTAAPKSPSSTDEFDQLLADYLQRIDEEGSSARVEFRSRHPEFASQLGRQLDWLAERLSHGRDGVPETIGAYKVRRRLGVGGMGEVFLAEQTTPFRRLVAIKIVKLGRDSESRLERFADEIQALALLNHNGIAKVFEAGSDGGRPFFTMEYVPGKPITEYCSEERLSVGERFALFLQVCRAVEYAHRQGILHRDLKPSNILVYGPRSQPVVKIIDFGLAKAIQTDESRPLTQTVQIVGTLDYLAPEQVDDADTRVVDTRTDVYALGVGLYQLLTGVLPLGIADLRDRDLDSILRAIRERKPTTPSARVDESSPGSAWQQQGVSLRRLRRTLTGDVDSIVMKALAKDAKMRYGGVSELIDDIERYLRCEPVLARPQTSGYLLRKFVRRNRKAVVFASVVVVLVLTSLVVLAAVQRESDRRLERGDLLEVVHKLEALRLRDALPPPARAEHLDYLQAWLREFDALAAKQDDMRRYLEAGAAAVGAVASQDRPAGGADDEAIARAAVVNALEALTHMTRSGGERDKMRLRIDWARGVQSMTVEDHRDAWARVQREVAADESFGGLHLLPQVGLIPLGLHKQTGLQQFSLPLPGADVPRKVDGRYVVGSTTQPVFVLLPGDPDMLVGAQNADASRPRYDRELDNRDAELRRVVVDPFFASCYEFTEYQWRLLYPDGSGVVIDVDADHPVTGVYSGSIQHVAHAWGMRLPSPGEWEYLARAGTDSPRWFGDWEPSQIYENIFDRSLDDRGSGEGGLGDWYDGHPGTAPVGSFPANGFLMHDVLGNAFEPTAVRVDGGWELDLRGGSWHTGTRQARSAARVSWDGGGKPSIGFRPVISLPR